MPGAAAVPAAGPANNGAVEIIAHLLEQRTGQRITDGRMWRVETALKPLLREMGGSALNDLVKAMVTARDGILADRVVDAVLNQETSFFRDASVLDQAVGAFAAMHAAAPTRRLRIWSAACATGQEPLSIAMLLEEQGLGNAGVEIVATDVSETAIGRARSGLYTQFEIQRGLPVRRMMTWFDGSGADWTAKPDLLRRVQYRRHNLIEESAPAGRFDIVLCRNLLIYFAPSLRAAALDRIADALQPGGLLVLGAGETVIGQTRRFVPSEQWRGLYRLA